MLCATDVADAVLFAVTQPPRLTITELRLMPTVYSPRR
jgi:NADP-dependent 3-hydroxy acid dehydrogenase YdfG